MHALMLQTVLASPRVFADDTPLPVLEPGRGRTKTGRLWCYAVDNRPWQGPGHPAVAYLYSEDRKSDHPAEHLKGFHGLLQVDGYPSFALLVTEAVGEAPQLVFRWARLPKVPRAKRVEWQARDTHGGSSSISTPPTHRR
jgi:hypothetical protein